MAHTDRVELEREDQPARHYLRLLDWMHCYLQPRSYLEIGVFEGKSLALALPCTRSLGVDPAPRIRYAIDSASMIFAETSDEFFSRHRPEELVGGTIDLSFVDGLHQFEFAIRDFINAEKHSSPDSVILIHDVFPPSAEVAGRPFEVPRWAGDVWKVIAALRAQRPDLAVHTVNAWPTGLAVVTGLDPTSTTLDDDFDAIVEEFRSLPYELLRDDADDILNMVSDVWLDVVPLLPAPFQSGDVSALRRARARRLPPSVGHVPGEVRRRLGISPLGPPLRSAARHLERLRRT